MPWKDPAARLAHRRARRKIELKDPEKALEAARMRAEYMRKWKREWKAKHPEKALAERKRDKVRRRDSGSERQVSYRLRDKRRGILAAIKQHWGCVDCGVRGLPSE